MIYTYVCDDCKTETENIQSIKEETLKEFPCEKCGKMAKKKFEIGGMIIPEHFRAVSGVYENNLANPDVLGPRLQRSRPSGKRKVWY